MSATTPVIAGPEPTPEPEPEPEPEPTPTPEPIPAVAVVAPMATPSAELDPNSTNNLLQLARRLHEEHVREGVEKRDALIAEGHTNAAKVVADADVAAAKLVSDAEVTQRAQIAQYDQERAGLQSRIDELRTFEREYRQKLKGYIEGQLRELDAAGGVSASASASDTPNAYGSSSA